MLSNSPKEWLANNRRLTLTIIVIAVLIVITIRFSWLSNRDSQGQIDFISLFRGIVDSLLGAIFVSFVVSTVLWWTAPPPDAVPAGFQISPKEISSRLEKSAHDADEWEYSGHTGRYVRSRIFPILSELAKKNNKRIRLRIIIADPRDKNICKYYVAYRSQARSKEMFNDNWTEENIRTELLATIISLIKLTASNRNIEADLGLRISISLVRIDRSNDRAVVTLEDPQEPAFDYPKGSMFYDYMKRQCAMDWDQCSQIDFRNSVFPTDWENTVFVKDFIDKILKSQDFNIDDITKAIAISKANRNPYA